MLEGNISRGKQTRKVLSGRTQDLLQQLKAKRGCVVSLDTLDTQISKVHSIINDSFIVIIIWQRCFQKMERKEEKQTGALDTGSIHKIVPERCRLGEPLPWKPEIRRA